jgi:hypothetical protein
MTKSIRVRRQMTSAYGAFLALATSVLVGGTCSAEERTLQDPSASRHCDVELVVENHRIAFGGEAVVTYRYTARHRKPERAVDERDDDVVPLGETGSSSQQLYNPFLMGGIFPSSGEIVVANKERTPIGVLSCGAAKTRSSTRYDWIELATDDSLGCEIPLMLAVPGNDGQIRSSPLPIGRYYLQARLRRRLWSDGPFATAEKKVSKLPNLKPPPAEDGRLTPELAKSFSDRMSGAAFRRAPEYPKFFEDELRTWLHPSGDEVIFYSNIVEIDVVDAEVDSTNK